MDDMSGGRVRTVLGASVAAVLLLAGCAAGPSLGDVGIVIGTALPVTSLDPAGDAGAGGEMVAQQVYPHLLTVKPGGTELVPDIAATAGFDDAGAYVATLKPGLTFANGNALTASDVVFSFTRQTAIAAAGGPSSLLGGIAKVTARDARTVVFTLATPGDQRFPDILASPAGAIVDEQSFPAKALATDHDIVAAQPFAGPYRIESQNPGDLLTFRADDGYAGALGAPRTADITLKIYADPDNLAADVTDGAIDLAYGGLEPGQVSGLRDADGVDIVATPGGFLRSLVFDLDKMPYGEQSTRPDPAKALAVRQAVADLVDRREIAEDVDAGATAPLFGFIPNLLPGASSLLETTTGDGRGAPDPTLAQRTLETAGVDTPVPLTIAIVPEQYGASSSDEFDALKTQLELGGLFQVTIKPVGANVFRAERSKGAYEAYEGGWSPRGTDPATYRSPYLVGDAQLGSHYVNPIALPLLAAPTTEADPAKRLTDLRTAQRQLATDMPIVPLVQQQQLAATSDGVRGIRFDGALTLRFGTLRLP
jgi:peptide/nickel transport system substrate-binding protein